MSHYHLVSTLHAARVTLADAHKAGDAAAATAAEAQVAAARAAVDAALADGRVAFATHLFDLNLDCLGAILSRLGPEDAFSASHTCTTLRSALFRGGLPGPLACVCRKPWVSQRRHPASAVAALRVLDDMEPALGALRLQFELYSFDEGRAHVLARALDAAPRASRIDIKLSCLNGFNEHKAGLLADILSSPDRAFAAAPQVHVNSFHPGQAHVLRRLTRAGVCVSSIGESDSFGAQIVANTLTQLHIHTYEGVNLPTQFPALRRLDLQLMCPSNFTFNMPSFTALAPCLKEIEFGSIFFEGAPYPMPLKYGFGFEPRLFAQFLAAIKGVTRIRFDRHVEPTLSQNENENLGQLTALRTLRDLEISTPTTGVELVPTSSDNPPHAPVAQDVITNLPPLPPRLTRLAFGAGTRVAFCHPLPELRVLDLRDLQKTVECTGFIWIENDDVFDDDRAEELFFRFLDVPLAIPSASIAPKLHTLLIGYERGGRIPEPRGDFDLWTLVAAPTALRVVVIEHTRLFCSAPVGFETTTDGFAALLARDAKELVSVHTHDCEIEGGHERAVENFLRAVEQRGGRVCRAGVEECLFCMLHDGTDLWR